MNPQKLPTIQGQPTWAKPWPSSVSVAPGCPTLNQCKDYFKHRTCYNCGIVGSFCVELMGYTQTRALCSCGFRTVAPNEFVLDPPPDTAANAGSTVGFYGSPPRRAPAYSTKDPKPGWFKDLKRMYTAGTVISLRRAPGASNVGISLRESQEFLIRELDEENCGLLLSPVKDGRVADVSSLFTAPELDKFTVSLSSLVQQDPIPQKDQLLPKGPYVTVQSYYERWE